MYILSSKIHRSYITIAEDILNVYVEKFSEIYGWGFCSYNIHNLLHIADDCRRFGVLDHFSCFQFENQLGWIINLIMSGYKPLEQVAKRITSQFEFECSMYNSESKKKQPPLQFKEGNRFLKIVLNDSIVLRGDSNDQWFITKQNEIVSFKYANAQQKLFGNII